MEPGSDLSFSISVLSNEFLRLSTMYRIVSKDHPISKTLQYKIMNVSAAMNIIHGVEAIGDFDYSIYVLRSNLNWLKKQELAVPQSSEIIEEIEYVTQLLRKCNER